MVDTNLKQKLLDKDLELREEISRREEEIQGKDLSDVRNSTKHQDLEDPVCDGIEEIIHLTQTLAEVRAALQRLEDGTYGPCADCGRPIEPGRLEIVPWALYCLRDQGRRDARKYMPQGSTSF